MATLKMAINWFEDQLSPNAGESIAESSKGSILQYFRPSLSYHLSLRIFVCLFLRGCFTQLLLYYSQVYLCQGPIEV